MGKKEEQIKMRSMSYGNISVAECDEHDGISYGNNGCASCLYEAGRLSALDVLTAVIDNELSETERTAVRLYWFRKMKIRQIAEFAGVAESNIRKTLGRAYKRIGSIMKYIVLYNEMLDGRTKLPEDFAIKIIRSNDGKELYAG